MYGQLKFSEGDVVQLKSGGAPLTVTGAEHTRSASIITVTAMSPGGLLQSAEVDIKAVKRYDGPLTPSHPEKKHGKQGYCSHWR
jgi:hypothetical protein